MINFKIGDKVFIFGKGIHKDYLWKQGIISYIRNDGSEYKYQVEYGLNSIVYAKDEHLIPFNKATQVLFEE